MTFEKAKAPDDGAHTLTFFCDTCPDMIEFRGSSEPNYVASWTSATEDGWYCAKFGRSWNHFCPGCSQLAKEEQERRREEDARRERMKARNARD